MLSKLFKRKSRLEDTDPAVRGEAIEALADDAQDVFERFARDDDNLDVRRAALARMSNRDAIAPLLEVEGLCDVAAQSIALLPASDEESTADNHPKVLICRIALSEDSDQVIALAGKLNEPKLVAAALRKINAASVRFAVVEKIWDEATLVEIEREMKGHAQPR